MQARNRLFGSGIQCNFGFGQADRETGACLVGAIEGDRSAVPFDKLGRDGKAKAGAAFARAALRSACAPAPGTSERASTRGH